VASLPAVRGIERTTAGFRAELVRMARRLGLQPEPILAVMALESGINAQAVSPTSGATGLIQFMPSTAKKLGTTVEALRQMNATAQLAFVERFFLGVPRLKAGSAQGDYYLAVFMPAFVGLPGVVPIAVKGSPVYDQNAGLDANKDGVLTVGDVRGRLDAELSRAAALPPVVVDENAPSDASGSPGGSVDVLWIGGAALVAWWLWRSSRGSKR
jgi:hypothetical protein